MYGQLVAYVCPFMSVFVAGVCEPRSHPRASVKVRLYSSGVRGFNHVLSCSRVETVSTERTGDFEL